MPPSTTRRRRVYLMRHGDVEYFADGVPVREPELVTLTDRGRERASAAGRALREVTFDRVVTSGLPRTVTTAELVVAEQRHGVPPLESWPDLEELHHGDARDIADDDLEHAVMSAFAGPASPEASFLGGETVGALVRRVSEAVDRLLADDWDTALLVLHGAVNRAILSRALTGGDAFFGQLEQAPACVNVLDHGPGWIIQAVNVRPYDPVPTGSRATTMDAMLGRYREHRAGIGTGGVGGGP